MRRAGDFKHGEKVLERALSFALQTDHLGTIGLVEFSCGAWLSVRRDGQRALKHLEESQTFLFLGQAWSWLGRAHRFMGQPKTAVDLTEKGLNMHTDLGMPFFRSWFHSFCSFAHFELGDLEKARTHAELALKFSMENNERLVQGLSRTWLGRVVAKTQPTGIEEAERHFCKE